MVSTRVLAASAALVLGGGLAVTVTGTATAAEGPTPPHSHLLVNGLVWDEVTDWPVSIKGCRPLANNRAVPLHAHHDKLHTGKQSEKLWAAGNAVVPVFLGEDGTPWTDCASLREFFGV